MDKRKDPMADALCDEWASLLLEAHRRLGAYSESTLEELCRLAVPRLADCCQFHLFDADGDLRRVARACQSGSCAHCGADSPAGLALALRSQRLQRDAGSSGAGQSVIVPLCARERALGALTLGWLSPIDDGSIRWAELFAHPVALAVEARRLERIAEESGQIRDQFLSATSHALRSPLATLRLQLQVSLRRLEQGEPPTPMTLRKSLAQTDQLNSLITDLVDASRIGAGELTLERHPVEFRALLHETVQVFRQAHPGRQVDVLASEPATVTTDRRRLSQLVRQLLDNAARFSEERTNIRVSLTVGDGELVLAVTDQGIGIPPGELLQVFDRFFRASNANNISSQGLGLGLYIGRAIALGHGGRVWAESEPTKGSVFRVALPLRAVDAAAH
jgi:signal transduction histidine kinase